jgi:hypothetical protein
MTNETRSTDLPVSDEQVSVAYSAASNETVPNRLNERVLRTATDSTPDRNRTRWSVFFMRPFAFAALLIISLAMILQFNSELNDQLQPVTEDEYRGDVPATDDGGRTAVQAGGISNPTGTQQIQDAAASGARNLRAIEELGSLHSNQQPSDVTKTLSEARPASSCSEQQSRSPELWWNCIAELVHSGNQDAARHEKERLVKTFPDFTPPPQ